MLLITVPIVDQDFPWSYEERTVIVQRSLASAPSRPGADISSRLRESPWSVARSWSSEPDTGGASMSVTGVKPAAVNVLP